MTGLQIQYFLSIARHMSFTKAAQEHYVSQPSLSKQIATLEAELGVELFDRSVKTRLSLTLAGTILNETLSRCVEEFQVALEDARRVSGNTGGTLRLGCVDTMNIVPLIHSVLRLWEEYYPEVNIIVEGQDINTLNSGLLSGEYDAIVQLDVQMDELRGMGGIHMVNIYNGHGIFLYSAKSPLAKKADLKPEDFESEPFYPLGPPGSAPATMAATKYLRSLGFVPHCIPMPSHEAIFNAISAGRGFGMFHPWLRGISNPEFCYLEVDDTIPVNLAWRKDNRNILARMFCHDLQFQFETLQQKYGHHSPSLLASAEH